MMLETLIVAAVMTLSPGKTYLDHPIEITSSDVVLEGAADGSSVLSGGRRLDGLVFERGDDGVFYADCRIPKPDQLFVNGARYHMARFPNRNPGEGRNVYDVWRLGSFEGAGGDALDPERVKRWSRPEGGYIHAMQELLWGDMHWRITGRRDDGSLIIEGGWQNNRPTSMHGVYRYVENIREELDQEGEWFYDDEAGRLYVMPVANTDLATAVIETAELASLVKITGASIDSPITNVVIRNIRFEHTARTFMDTKERILRSDWAMYRGAAVELRNTSGCCIENCDFDELGGNAVIFDRFNRDGAVVGCAFTEIGASGVMFLGDTLAVKVPIYDYAQTAEMSVIDRTPGPASEEFPRDCMVADCLFYRTGREEKQSAAVTIDISSRITVRDSTIAFTPRAGVNIGEGAFGGHLIEGCDIFDTVLETGDHGAFNSWGRDRWWSASLEFDDDTMMLRPELLRADMLEDNVIRANRLRCDYGWDIDLDDGSSFYTIESNVCLAGGIKLREGFKRLVRGNYCANNGLHPHCWLRDSGDIVTNNVFFAPFAPVWHGPYRGLFTAPNTYVRPGEEKDHPLPFGAFGVKSERLRELRRRLTEGPAIPELHSRAGDQPPDEAERRVHDGMTWRRFNGPLEYSAFGVRADFAGWVLESGAREPFKDGDLLEGELPDGTLDTPITVIRNQSAVAL